MNKETLDTIVTVGTSTGAIEVVNAITTDQNNTSILLQVIIAIVGLVKLIINKKKNANQQKL